MRVAWLAVGLLVGGVATAAPDKPEKPSSAVKRVAKAFSKLRSYRVSAEIRGGQARGAAHDIVSSTVNERYSAEVVSKLCRVSAPEAFRPRFDSQAGAISGQGRWMAMLATDDGRLLARLFLPAEQFLAEAAKYRRTAEWVDAGGEGETPRVLASRSDDRSADQGATGTRTADDRDRSSSDDAAESEAPQPRRLRVQGPNKVALQHFLTIQNSGCFSAG